MYLLLLLKVFWLLPVTVLYHLTSSVVCFWSSWVFHCFVTNKTKKTAFQDLYILSIHFLIFLGIPKPKEPIIPIINDTKEEQPGRCNTIKQRKTMENGKVPSTSDFTYHPNFSSKIVGEVSNVWLSMIKRFITTEGPPHLG